MVKLIALFSLFLTACSFGSGNLESRHSTDLESRRIRRIAVVPPTALSGGAQSKVLLGTTPEPRAPERDAGELLARIAYSVTSAMPNWQIVSDREVREVAETLSPAAEPARLRQIGQSVYADAVLTGRIQRYRELDISCCGHNGSNREGLYWGDRAGATRPAGCAPHQRIEVTLEQLVQRPCAAGDQQCAGNGVREPDD